jgi:cystathionine beta-lyase
LRQQLQANKDQVASFVAEQLPQIRVVKGNATYLVWLDISQLNLSATQFSQQLRAQTGLFLSNGAEYRGNGDQFVRINVACPAERLTDGLQRLKRGVETIIRSA